MAEATKQALSEFIRQAVTAAHDGSVWVAGQAPLLVQEWLHWTFVEALIGVGTSLVTMAIGLALLWYAKRNARSVDEEGNPLPIFGFIVGLLMCVVSFVEGGSHASTAAKVYIAPRVVVIEKLNDMIK